MLCNTKHKYNYIVFLFFWCCRRFRHISLLSRASKQSCFCLKMVFRFYVLASDTCASTHIRMHTRSYLCRSFFCALAFNQQIQPTGTYITFKSSYCLRSNCRATKFKLIPMHHLTCKMKPKTKNSRNVFLLDPQHYVSFFRISSVDLLFSLSDSCECVYSHSVRSDASFNFLPFSLTAC